MSIPERKPELLRTKEALAPEPLVIDISEYEGKSGRLIGIKELRAIGARTPDPFFLVTHEAFEKYKKEEMTEGLRNIILSTFREIIKKNPHRGAFVGWRTVTPEGAPPGKRTSVIYDEREFLSYIEEAWQFAIDKGYDKQGNEVVLALHPFIHAAQSPIKEGVFLWPGGDAAPLADGRIHIRASFGPDEVVQGFTYVCDSYIVRKGRYETLIQKKLAAKTRTLKPVEGDYLEVSIPPDYQNRQALEDPQILEVAAVAKDLEGKYGFRRLEFILQQEGLVIRECVPYDPEPANFFFLKKPLTQRVVVINSEKDIERVNPPEAIVHLPRHLFIERKVPDISLLLTARAQEEIEMAVLSWGEIETQHMAKNFQAAEVSVIFTGDQALEEGQKVRVYEEDGTPAWEIIGEKKKEIIDLDDPKSRERELVGEKAANLSILKKEGISVPPGFYLPTAGLEKHLQSLGLKEAVKELDTLKDKALREKVDAIREKILSEPLSEPLRGEIQERLSQFPNSTFSVRSSSIYEERAAGQFQSYLNVPSEDVPVRAKECFASLFSFAPLQHARKAGILPSEMKMAVLIHQMIKGKGGVIYTSPLEITISAGQSAETITSGTETNPHKITIEKKSGKIKTEEFPPEGSILSREEIERLFTLALKIESIFEASRDIEWTIDDEEGKPWILQARPRV